MKRSLYHEFQELTNLSKNPSNRKKIKSGKENVLLFKNMFFLLEDKSLESTIKNLGGKFFWRENLNFFKFSLAREDYQV